MSDEFDPSSPANQDSPNNSEVQNEGSEGANEGAAADPFKNLKAELTRKMSNSESQVQRLSQENAAIMAKLDALMVPRSQPAETSEEDLGALLYSKPGDAVKAITQQVTRTVQQDMQRMTQNQQQQAAVLSSLVKDYPELSDSNSDFAKSAVRAFDSLPAHLKNDPAGYKLAVREAAADLGVLPSHKRGSRDADDFVMSGGNRSANSARPSRGAPQTGLSDGVMEAASIFGLDLSKPERKKSLEKRTQRKNWGRWE